jgi:hypothetical protein
MAEQAEEAAPTSGLNPSALTPQHAARLLTKASGQTISVDWILADLAADAPANADGTISLVHYAAWLVRENAPRD